MKNTKQRKIVLDIVNNSDSHLDAFGVYKLARMSIPNISLGTVYRNLGSLENEGAIQVIMVDGVKHYDKIIPHYHFICKKCLKIIDVFDLEIPKLKEYNGNLVDEKEDSLVGIKRFGQLFPTYFLYRVVVALAGIVVGVIGMLLMYTMITDAQFSNLSQLVLMYVNKSTISQDEIVNIVASLSNVFSFVFILVIIISILSVYLSLKFGLFNYILQKYNYTGLTALKESSRLMKGNKWTLFKLEFSFFGWMILAGLVSGVVAMFVETIMPIPFLATFITGVVSTFFSAYFYDVKLNTCFAVCR